MWVEVRRVAPAVNGCIVRFVDRFRAVSAKEKKASARGVVGWQFFRLNSCRASVRFVGPGVCTFGNPLSWHEKACLCLVVFGVGELPWDRTVRSSPASALGDAFQTPQDYSSLLTKCAMFDVSKKTKTTRRGCIFSRGATQYKHNRRKKRGKQRTTPTTTPEPLRFVPPDRVRYNSSSGLNLDERLKTIHRRSGT